MQRLILRLMTAIHCPVSRSPVLQTSTAQQQLIREWSRVLFCDFWFADRLVITGIQVQRVNGDAADGIGGGHHLIVARQSNSSNNLTPFVSGLPPPHAGKPEPGPMMWPARRLLPNWVLRVRMSMPSIWYSASYLSLLVKTRACEY